MLKNLDPLLTGALLALLDGMEPGQWLMLTAGRPGASVPDGQPVADLSAVSTESAVSAILSVLPLDTAGAPIVYLDRPDAGADLPDVVFAVCGIASDAELRRVPMSRLDDADFALLAAQSALTVHSAAGGEPAAFLLRKGSSARA